MKAGKRKKIQFLLVAWMAMILIWGCSSPLEKSAVPVWAGISIDSARACPQALLSEGVEALRSFQMAGCVVELPLTVYSEEESHIFTYYEGHSLDTLTALLAQEGLPYALHFHLRNPFEVPPERFREDLYLTDMSGLLLRTSAYPPSYIIFSGQLLDPVLMKGQLDVFITNLREAFSPFQGEIVLAAKPFDILAPGFPWELADAVGITYPPPAELGYKSYFRDLNSRLSRVLQEQQKPAMIVHSNLLGEDKTLLFRNELRFWSKETEIRWINLNTLYCYPSLSDTLTYFSLGRDGEFQAYLKDYLHP